MNAENGGKRTRQVMVRLTAEERTALECRKPPDEPLAVFARRVLLAAIEGVRPPDAPVRGGELRFAAAFVVACLSAEITLEQAGALFDRFRVPETGEEDGDGSCDPSDERDLPH